jgi:hypothetical protein
MARKFYSPPRLYDALKAEGFELPEDCADVELALPVDGMIQLKLVLNLTGKRLQQFGRALVVLGRDENDSETWPSASVGAKLNPICPECNKSTPVGVLSVEGKFWCPNCKWWRIPANPPLESGNRTFTPADALKEQA